MWQVLGGTSSRGEGTLEGSHSCEERGHWYGLLEANPALIIPVKAGLFIGNSEGLLIHFHVLQ
jgi:hypothetical protein